MRKKTTIAVLAFMLLLQGCAFLGIDLTDDRTITVIKSPYLVNLSGDVAAEDEMFVRHTLELLATQPFQNYQFQAVQIHVTGSESDSEKRVTIAPTPPEPEQEDDTIEDEEDNKVD